MQHTSLRHNLATNVRHLREAQGLSQEQLATRAGLHRTYVGAIERAERNVTLASVDRLAGALGVEPLTLLQTPPKSDQA